LRTIVLALALPISACTSVQPPAEQVTIVWNRVDDAQAACQAVSGRREIFVIRGCAKWSDAGKGARSCSIYAPEPKTERDLQAFATLGHELMHCFDGNWHDRWGNANLPDRRAGVGASASPR
jgi:hypothetical protein